MDATRTHIFAVQTYENRGARDFLEAIAYEKSEKIYENELPKGLMTAGAYENQQTS